VFGLLADAEILGTFNAKSILHVCACVCWCVKSTPEVMQLVWAVVKLRARCPTLVHANSSRSHLVVTLTASSNSPHALALGGWGPHTH
jgi:hypothetical protein